MHKYTHHDQRTAEILCVLCDEKQSVQQVAEEQQHDDGAEKPQFLADNREDHIVLRLRNGGQLLRTVAQTFSEKAAGSDGVKTLQHLVAAGVQIIFRLKPGQDSADTEVGTAAYRAVQHDKPHTGQPGASRHQRDKRDCSGVSQENDEKADTENDNCRT